MFAEVAIALLVLTRAGRLTNAAAGAIVDEVVALPLEAVSLRSLAPVALPLAAASGLSVYDACYLAVAEAWDAVLVTADQRLAAAADQSTLLP